MDPVEFANWLSGMKRLNGEQIALALAELGEFAGRSGAGDLGPSAEAPPEAELSGARAKRKASLSIRLKKGAMSRMNSTLKPQLRAFECDRERLNRTFHHYKPLRMRAPAQQHKNHQAPPASAVRAQNQTAACADRHQE